MRETATSLLLSLETGRQLQPLSDRLTGFDLEAAHRVADDILSMRIARGERPVGWKIGFTNRTIWDEYGVHAPIWGPVYDTTVRPWDPNDATADIDTDRFVEPRIEPEIVLRVARAPNPDMDDQELLSCVDAVAHGFEIVQSVYPAWRFRAADTVAAFALHGALVHGPFTAIDHQRDASWIETLASFEIDLFRNGEHVDHGHAANVLDGPLSAFRHFVAGLHARPMRRGIEEGDLISTGTLTRAFPIEAGETWTTRLTGLSLPGMRLRVGGGDETRERLVSQAAQGRFHLETPDSCNGPEAYEQAVTSGLAAETALSHLLYRDEQTLNETRLEIERRATRMAIAWKNRPTP